MALDNNTVLNYTDKTTIKNWFKTGLKPTQTQFWSTWDSFWHKSESLPISSITNLANLLDSKAEENHEHNQYAKNDATSLTADNVTAWQQKLGVADLKFDDKAITTTQDYADFGLQSGATINAFNNAVYEAITGGEFGKNFANTDLVISENRKHTGTASVELATPMIYSNPSQRYSGLIDKSSDATYNVFPVLDDKGNLAKASNAINALIKTASVASQSQKNTFLSYLNGSNFSGTISITSFGNPFVFKNKGIQQLNVIGLNLNLDINNANVFVIKSGTTTEIPVNFSNVNSTTLAIQLNTDSLDEGEYYVRIRANFQNHTSVRLFRLLDVSNSETIDLSSQTATIIYNSNIPNPTGLYSVSNGAIIANSYDTSVVENNPFGAISITLGNLTFEDDFIISGTYNSTGGNPSNSINTHTFGISTGVISTLVNPVLYGFTPRNYQNKQSVALVGASGETGPTNGSAGASFSFSWVISKSESMITLNVINPSTGVSVFNAVSIIDHSGSVTFSFFGSRNQGNWIASTNIASVIKINK